MRYVRYAILGCLGLVLISVSLANRGDVTLNLVPEALTGLLGGNHAITLPLFVVVLGGIATGVILGFVWEWLREHKHRREIGTKGREVRRLEREVGRLKDEKHRDKDEVLAILDSTG